MPRREHRFATPGELVVDVTIPDGRVEIETVDGEDTTVAVSARREDALERLVVALEPRGAGHVLVVDAADRTRISLPAGGVQFTWAGGIATSVELDVRIRCPHGCSLGVRSAAADVTARGRIGRAAVRTVSGRVDLEHLCGDTAVKTASGDIELRRVDGAAAVQVGTVSGDVAIGIGSGLRLRVDARTISGELASELDLGDEQIDGDGPLVDVRAKTVSGDVRLVRA